MQNGDPFSTRQLKFLSGAWSHSRAGSSSRSGHVSLGCSQIWLLQGHQGQPVACPQPLSCRLAPEVMTTLQPWAWVCDRLCPPVLLSQRPSRYHSPNLGTAPVPSGVQAPLGGSLGPLCPQPLLARVCFVWILSEKQGPGIPGTDSPQHPGLSAVPLTPNCLLLILPAP